MQMFSSSRKTEPAAPMAPTPPPPQPPAAKPNPAANGATDINKGGTLSSGVSIKGTVKFQKELLIDCEVEGRIDSQGRLTVGKQAKIKGDIKTRSVIVDGNVNGNITAAERCELRAGCTVNGDIEAPRLVVDDAASFVGSAKIATQKQPAASA